MAGLGRCNPCRDSGCAAVSDKPSKIAFTDDLDGVTDTLHFFGFSVLAASSMSGKKRQILIPDDEVSGLLGHARFY